MRRPSRDGMTLLETVIAITVFSVMIALVMETLISYRNFAFAATDADALEEQASRAQAALARDFSDSGWFYCTSRAGAQKFYPQIHTFTLPAWQPYQITPPPSVSIPTYDVTTGRTSNVTYTASVTHNLSTSLGDAVVFTRLQPEGATARFTPVNYMGSSVVTYAMTDPNSGKTIPDPPVRMDQFAQARAINSLVINPASTDQSGLTSVQWETTPTMIANGLTSSMLYDDTKVRLLCYRVIPDPRHNGRGQLVRLFNNPGKAPDPYTGDRNDVAIKDIDKAGWFQDAVIATDVLAMHVYTAEMSSWYSGTANDQDFNVNVAAGLSQNQIRIVIQFARNLSQANPDIPIDLNATIGTRANNTRITDPARGVTTKTLQFTVGLRSVTNTADQ